MNRLGGKVSVITGGAGGIGRVNSRNVFERRRKALAGILPVFYVVKLSPFGGFMYTRWKSSM